MKQQQQQQQQQQLSLSQLGAMGQPPPLPPPLPPPPPPVPPTMAPFPHGYPPPAAKAAASAAAATALANAFVTATAAATATSTAVHAHPHTPAAHARAAGFAGAAAELITPGFGAAGGAAGGGGGLPLSASIFLRTHALARGSANAPTRVLPPTPRRSPADPARPDGSVHHANAPTAVSGEAGRASFKSSYYAAAATAVAAGSPVNAGAGDDGPNAGASYWSGPSPGPVAHRPPAAADAATMAMLATTPGTPGGLSGSLRRNSGRKPMV
jgi:hypothetical protein